MKAEQHQIPLTQRLLGIRPEEAPTVAWSFLYVCVLFLTYYVLRPIRDELGVASGVSNLPWLFSGALLAMITLNPLFGYLNRFSSIEQLQTAVRKYIHYYNHHRIKHKLKGLSPVQYRTQSLRP